MTTILKHKRPAAQPQKEHRRSFPRKQASAPRFERALRDPAISLRTFGTPSGGPIGHLNLPVRNSTRNPERLSQGEGMEIGGRLNFFLQNDALFAIIFGLSSAAQNGSVV